MHSFIDGQRSGRRRGEEREEKGVVCANATNANEIGLRVLIMPHCSSGHRHRKKDDGKIRMETAKQWVEERIVLFSIKNLCLYSQESKPLSLPSSVCHCVMPPTLIGTYGNVKEM